MERSLDIRAKRIIAPRSHRACNFDFTTYIQQPDISSGAAPYKLAEPRGQLLRLRPHPITLGDADILIARSSRAQVRRCFSPVSAWPASPIKVVRVTLAASEGSHTELRAFLPCHSTLTRALGVEIASQRLDAWTAGLQVAPPISAALASLSAAALASSAEAVQLLSRSHSSPPSCDGLASPVSGASQLHDTIASG